MAHILLYIMQLTYSEEEMKKLITVLVLGMMVVTSVAAFAGDKEETKPADNQTQTEMK